MEGEEKREGSQRETKGRETYALGDRRCRSDRLRASRKSAILGTGRPATVRGTAASRTWSRDARGEKKNKMKRRKKGKKKKTEKERRGEKLPLRAIQPVR